MSSPPSLFPERTVRLRLEYDGTDFSGWQVQPGRRTVQGLLEGALVKMLTEPVAVVGSGRTDAGVHATGQVAHFRTTRSIPVDGLQRGLNAMLPWDLRVRDADAVPHSFHARRSAVSKEYRYQVYCGPVLSPFYYRYCHQSDRALDLARMRDAARRIAGRRDFSCFRAAGSSVRDSIRTVNRVEVQEAGPLVELHVSGDGFLRHMVRNIAGTLLEVGSGIRTPESVSELIESRDRGRAGPTAPARGLFLVRVTYPESLRADRADLPPKDDLWTLRGERLRAGEEDDDDDTN